MNFTELSTQSTLPQFSEISRSTGSDPLLSDTLYTSVADTIAKQALTSSQNKFQNAVLNLADSNAFVQFCEKPSLQALNIPVYSQNNSVLNVQSQILPMKFIQNICVQQDNDIEKNDVNAEKSENDDFSNQNLVMLEYLQNIRSGAIPLPLQQLVELQSKQIKKEKEDDQKHDQVQNNILNIPSVQIYKTSQILNDSLMNDNTVLAINPVNMLVEDQTENHLETQTQIEGEKLTIKTDNVEQKPQKKTKFRPKMGEIKVTIGTDGTTLFQCPECMSTFSNRSDIDEHIQKHLGERKFKCAECGALLKRREHLDQHVRGHSNERPFRCKICPKAFKRNEHLTRHFVTHSGDKNFPCQICNKAFSRKDHLTKHTQTHLGIRKPKLKKVTSLVTNDVDVTINAIASPTSTTMLLRPDFNSILKDGGMKQEVKTQQLFQQIQNMQDSKLVFSMLQEQLFKDSAHHQAVNMNEILPQSTRYLAPT